MSVAEEKALNAAYLVCPACDALWEKPELKPGQRARCGRCHDVIYEKKMRSWERVIPATIGALILYIAAVSFPFLGMERSGLTNRISVIDTPGALWSNGMHILSITVFVFILVFPVSRLIMLAGVMMLHYGRHPSRLAVDLMSAYQRLGPWAMADIFVIGVVVALVKLGAMVTITIGPSFWAMIGFVSALAIVGTQLCRDTMWEELGDIREQG